MVKVKPIPWAFVAMAIAVVAANNQTTNSSQTATTENTAHGNSSTTTEKTDATHRKPCPFEIGPDEVFMGLNVKDDMEKILEKTGGPPGKVNVTWINREDVAAYKEKLETSHLLDSDEKYWLYKYADTDAHTYVRFEHAVRQFSGTKEYTEILGHFYFKPDDFCGTARHSAYSVDDRGFTFKVLPVVGYYFELAMATVPVDIQTTNSSQPPTRGKTYATDSERCHDMIGTVLDGIFLRLAVKYDLEKILEKNGGPPGKVNVTWTDKEDAPVNKEDLKKRPLPDADEKYWLYKYADTDARTYIRLEHAVRRFSGTPKEFTEIRGKVYFTPDDFCGNARIAVYSVDDRGFTFEVFQGYCTIGVVVTCYYPDHCTTRDNSLHCIKGPVPALLSSLVGGGK